jgi:hypothetical protein
MTIAIRDLVRRFYQAQIDGDYATQRQLTTARYQRDKIDPMGFVQWGINQHTAGPFLSGAQNIDVTIRDTDARDGSVTIDIRGLRYSKRGSGCSTWEGISWARYEYGRWRYDPYLQATPTREARWGVQANQIIGAGCL